VNVNDDVLAIWKDILEPVDVPARQARMVYAVNRSVAKVLERLATSKRIGTLDLLFSQGWNEKTDFDRGYFRSKRGVPDTWSDVILHGVHLFVGTPLYKTPNDKGAWIETDFEALADDSIPATLYKPIADRKRYDAAYTTWQVAGADRSVHTVHARDKYRTSWRCMADPVMERTLMPAVIPPGAAHVDGVFSVAATNLDTTIHVAAVMGSLISDFAIRSVPKSTIRASSASRLPLISDPAIEQLRIY